MCSYTVYIYGAYNRLHAYSGLTLVKPAANNRAQVVICQPDIVMTSGSRHFRQVVVFIIAVVKAPATQSVKILSFLQMLFINFW